MALGDYSPPTLASGSRSTLDFNQNGRKPDVAMSVADLDPNMVPILQLTKKSSKKKAVNPLFSWFEDKPFPWWTYADGAVASTVTEDVTLPTGHGKFVQYGTMLYNMTTDEILRVKSVSGDVATCERGAAGSTPANIGNLDDLRIMGSAHAEGGDESVPKSTVKTHLSNYCQIFKTSFGASNTAEASEWYWGNDRPTERRTRGTDHAIDIESAFLFGAASESTDPVSGDPVRTTAGILAQITTNTTSVGAALTEPVLDNFIDKGFRYASPTGKNVKWLFCSRLIARQINAFAQDRLQTRPSDKSYGIKVTEYLNVHGTVMLMTHNLLEDNYISGATGGGHSGTAILVDPESPTYRFLQGRDTKLKRDVQPNGADRWQDEYITEAGFQLKGELWNAVMTGVTA